jgi:hypothetical protein
MHHPHTMGNDAYIWLGLIFSTAQVLSAYQTDNNRYLGWILTGRGGVKVGTKASTSARKHGNTKAPKHQSTKAPKHQSIKAPKHQSTKAPKHQSTKASKHQSTKVAP